MLSVLKVLNFEKRLKITFLSVVSDKEYIKKLTVD